MSPSSGSKGRRTPRGVLAIAETQEEAEKQVLKDAPQFRVLRSREIDLAGLPPLLSGPLPKQWVVVVEHCDPVEEAKLPQEQDPEEARERQVRQLYLAMAIDPALLVSGVTEQFDCPVCSQKIQVNLPAPREARDPEHATCPQCKTPLRRPKGQLRWEIIDTTRQPRPRCIFCNAQADSHEHVVPR